MRKHRSGNAYLCNSVDSVLHFKEVKSILLQWFITKLTTFCSLFVYITLILEQIAANLIYRFNELSNYLTSCAKRKKLLKQWIESKVNNCKISNFTEDFKSGITLCALMESIVKGSCPRYDLLNYDNAKCNIELFLQLLRKHLNIIAEIDAQQILDACCEEQLICLLSKMKLVSSKFVLKPILKRSKHGDSIRKKTSFELNVDENRNCFAKGMGLMLAVKGKKSRFNIFHEPSIELDLVIEIEGVHNSFCRERITNKRSNCEIISSTFPADIRFRRNSRYETIIIPVYYDILVDRIAVTYIPVEVGKHRLSIVCLGQHIMGSPFSVDVDDSAQFPNFADENSVIRPLINIPRNSTVIRKRVVRQTMLVNGVETPISGRQSLDAKPAVEIEVKQSFPRQLSANELMKEYSVMRFKDEMENVHFTTGQETEMCEVDSKLTVNGKGDASRIEEEALKSGNKFYNSDALENVNNFEWKPVETYRNSLQNSTESLDCKNTCKISLKKSSLDDLLCGDDPLSESVELKFQELVRSTVSHLDEMPSYFSFDESDCDVNKPIILDTIAKPQLKRQTTYEVISPSIQHRNSLEVSKNVNTSNNLYDSVKSRRKFFEDRLENNLNSQSSQSRKLKKEIGDGFNVKERKRFWESLNQNKAELVTSEVIIKEKESPNQSTTTLKASISQTDSGISAENTEIKPCISLNDKKLVNKHKYRSVSYPCLNRMNREKRLDSRILQSKDWFSMQFNGRSLSSSTAGFIDDEIPYFASLLEETGVTSEFTKSRDSLDTCPLKRETSQDFNIDPKDKGIYPENIIVSGPGINNGKVGVKNRFIVSTKYAGRSFLSVGIQGMEEDDLSYITMTYIGDSDYEVIYEVTRAGYFIIFIRYGDWNVADSPFICKVTF